MKRNNKLVIILVSLMLVTLITAVYAQSSANVSYKAGLKFFSHKKYREAIPHFDSAIETNGSFVKAYVFRGLSYYMLEDHNKAINDLNKALQLDPENVTALYGRGMAYLFTGKSQKAITDFSMVLKKQPENSKSYVNRAICYYRLNKMKKAVSDASKSISFNVKNPSPYFLRAACYWRQGLHKAAVLDLKRAVDLYPNGPNLQIMYYISKAHIGDTSTDQLKAFYEKNKKKADVWPYPAIAMMLGKIEPVDCIKAAKKFKPLKLRGTIEQQANFYVGEFFFIHKNQEKADKYRKLAMDGENKLFIIQSLVKLEYYDFKK
ncbi:MAG: tetratricopeptide repeat protein [Candidatus Eremiobacteraeota bacterium]|nr:tetratricopeptide repeat protein [Candidatus Eremiobacteraeota bacterium]